MSMRREWRRRWPSRRCRDCAVLEIAAEAGAARSRDRLQAHPAVRALHAPQPGDHVAALGAEIEVPPPAPLGVVGRATDLPAARADAAPAPQPHGHQHPLTVEPDPDHRRPGQPQDAVECRRDAHAARPFTPLTVKQPAASRTGACASITGAQDVPGDLAPKTLQFAASPAYPSHSDARRPTYYRHPRASS